MQDTQLNSLTQEELIVELHGRGYSDITARRVATWRGHDLLPPFDRTGAGLGQSRGRQRSSWTDGDIIINQALWICELSQSYESVDELILPLWMLGYHIPLDRVRQALSEPFQNMTEIIEAEAVSSGELYDLIGDAAYECVKGAASEGGKLLAMPQDALETLLNILFNPGYDLSDTPFEEGVEAMREYERAMQEAHLAAMAAKGFETDLTREDDTSGGFFKHAPLVKEFFSLYQLKRAVDECSDEDLLAVERDVDIMREAVLLMHKLYRIATRDLDTDSDSTPARTLPPIFMLGTFVVWADLSLRRRGFSEAINTYLPEGLRLMREKCDESVERELGEASQSIAMVVNTTIEVMAESFRQSAGAEESA